MIIKSIEDKINIMNKLKWIKILKLGFYF
jgi:hypothetical protein